MKALKRLRLDINQGLKRDSCRWLELSGVAAGVAPPQERWRRRCAGKKESADKPGSVEGNHSSGTAVTGDLERPTREPGRTPVRGPKPALLPYLVLLRVGFAVPRRVTTRAVRSYRTISPLPAGAGGIFSVALSVGSRPPGVTWHPVTLEPGLSSRH